MATASRSKAAAATAALTPAWRLVQSVLATLISGLPVLLWGPPGTGKTYAAVKCVPTGAKVFSLTLTEETPAAEIRGMYVPSDGRFVWQDGPISAAIRASMAGDLVRLVINELDKASQDCVSFLLAVLDDAGLASVTLPTGEVLIPGAGFTVVATMNSKPDMLIEALADRFPVAIELAQSHPAAYDGLPDDVREAAKAFASASADRRISLRAWMAFSKLRTHLGGDTQAAASAIFGARATDLVSSLRIAAAPSDARPSEA